MKDNPRGHSADHAPFEILDDVPLAPRTTIGLGGSAAHLVEAENADQAIEAVRWAGSRDLPVFVMGGGSNTVFADAGWPGLVVRAAMRGVAFEESDEGYRVTAAAGESWDAIVERATAEDLTGIECLSGIPGLVGATPIQNVGAYGQEVADVIETVQVLDLEDLEIRSLSCAECGFGYRSSRFRISPGRYVILAVSYLLRRGAPTEIAYRELAERLEPVSAAPSTAEIREAVLDLRRAKSMVIDPDDPDSRSVGSFFVNPVVDGTTLSKIESSLAAGQTVPRFEIEGGRFKIAAAWLIESAGFEKGDHRGAVGISSAHALALVHRGGGRTAELISLAREIRTGVLDRFGIELHPEPVFVGFKEMNPLD